MDESYLDLTWEQKSREKSEQLARLLYAADIPGSWVNFEILKGSWNRRRDKEITSIDQFFEKVAVLHASMAVGRKEDSPTESNVVAISVRLTGKFISDTSGSRHLQYCCPYNEENYAKANELFEKVYGAAIEAFKPDVPDI